MGARIELRHVFARVVARLAQPPRVEKLHDGDVSVGEAEEPRVSRLRPKSPADSASAAPVR